MDLRSLALQSGKGAVGGFIVFAVRLRFELLSEVAGVVRTEGAQRTEQRMRSAGEFGPAAARDGAAEVVEEMRRVIVEESDQPLLQRRVAVELIKEFFPGEGGERPGLAPAAGVPTATMRSSSASNAGLCSGLER